MSRAWGPGTEFTIEETGDGILLRPSARFPNVLVGLLTGDDPKQAVAARSLFAAGPIWIAKTVLLETGWVLRSLYGFEQGAIREAFTKLLGLKNAHTEDESSVATGLTLHGIELADAIHLCSRPARATFVSFHESFVRRAKRRRNRYRCR